MSLVARSARLRSFHRLSSGIRRFLSSESDPQPLFLWLGGTSSDSTPTTSSKNPLLLPVEPASSPTVSSVDEALSMVNEHYESSHFVGGMGESDPGVWFAGVGEDALAMASLVQETIELVQIERHGVPFGLYTSGLITPDMALAEIGLDILQVSLFAATPADYQAATGHSPKAFGQVCGFVSEAAEQGLAVEVGVLAKHAPAARDLALALGARNVHVY